ncbi:hypothetical protein CEXT_8601 [Caerostris extrusa]|uniref:Uncharacterized protein n=1 Tax=Caerostris extrusa TaxID=172846 RepID=A0AAV4MVA5_CAEEX|nr:hypothetical protein CEXT_8601 [Caerostris extrusa]
MNKQHFEVLLPTLLLLSSSTSFCVSVMEMKLIVNEHYAWLSIFLMGKCCVCLNEQSTFWGATTNIAAAVIFYFLLRLRHGNEIDCQRTLCLANAVTASMNKRHFEVLLPTFLLLSNFQFFLFLLYGNNYDCYVWCK